jgi:hypothetical protein
MASCEGSGCASAGVSGGAGSGDDPCCGCTAIVSTASHIHSVTTAQLVRRLAIACVAHQWLSSACAQMTSATLQSCSCSCNAQSRTSMCSCLSGGDRTLSCPAQLFCPSDGVAGCGDGSGKPAECVR